MSENAKAKILSELDSRLKRLSEHENDDIIKTGNEYDELNQALSKVIGFSLKKELENLRQFVSQI